MHAVWKRRGFVHIFARPPPNFKKEIKNTAGGFKLKATDAPTILAMFARGDREHDIAAWYGVNQGRVADVKGGEIWLAVPSSDSDAPAERGSRSQREAFERFRPERFGASEGQ